MAFLPWAEPLELPPSAWALAFGAAAAAGVTFRRNEQAAPTPTEG